MSRYLILAQSTFTANALKVWLSLIYPGRDVSAGTSVEARDLEVVITSEEAISAAGDTLTYTRLVGTIEQALQCDAGFGSDITVLVDTIHPKLMSAVAGGGRWSHIVSLLVLTFPEVRWTFGAIRASASDFPVHEHSLVGHLTGMARNPIFDPCGLRNWIRKLTNSDQRNTSLATRLNRAAAIDEEKHYALFHGYTAYRFGYRADTVDSWALLKDLFRSPAQKNPDAVSSQMNHGYSVLLEDMSLNFPDKPDHVHLLVLARRGDQLHLLKSEDPSLETATHRILITSGRDRERGASLEENEKYLKQKQNGKGRVVFKPTGGMLDLWSKAGLMDRVYPDSRTGNAPGFAWPPRGRLEESTDGHGAPGKLVLVAETLVRRAETLRNTKPSLEHSIKGAVLATDAVELLNGQTPIITLSALVLKHEFEVRAECAFFGAGYHFNVTGRTEEIANEVSAIAWSFASGRPREFSILNAQSAILHRLAMIFREEGQFDEESECMIVLRRHHRLLQLKRGEGESHYRLKKLLLWLPNVILSYAEFLVASFARFMMAITMWLVVLPIAWCALDSSKDRQWIKAVANTWGSFFGGSVSGDTGLLTTLSSFAAIAGFFHLGVFVSFVYALVVRK